MFSSSEEPIQQPNSQPVRLTQQLLGVLGEDEHFARQEAERRRKWVVERQATLLGEERERERALHFMKCPKCGAGLEELPFGGVRVDKCFSCDGLWLDKGELDLIRRKESGFIARMLSVFG